MNHWMNHWMNFAWEIAFELFNDNSYIGKVIWLVNGCHQFGIFPEILGCCLIIPIDELHHFFRGVGILAHQPDEDLHGAFQSQEPPKHPSHG